jgi:hypothetical protein
VKKLKVSDNWVHSLLERHAFKKRRITTVHKQMPISAGDLCWCLPGRLFQHPEQVGSTALRVAKQSAFGCIAAKRIVTAIVCDERFHDDDLNPKP